MNYVNVTARATHDALGLTQPRLEWFRLLLQIRVAEALASGAELSSLIGIASPDDDDIRVVTRAEQFAEWRAADLKSLVNKLADLEIPFGSLAVVLDCDDVEILVIPADLDAERPPATRTALPLFPSVLLAPLAP